MDKIQLLPDSVANQIAAGEVIQRPASVIKELVENSVDAGATEIKILVVDAGKTSIQVVDNGVGMSVTDARLAFERHATSKIRKAEDLFSLHTMGFRGEALPSICSVSQVTLRTRRSEDVVGTQLRIEGGSYISQEPIACPQGCNFLVENLFYNVPARRRFLKANTTELNNIITAFLRIALVYPNISFSLTSNGQELYNLKTSNTRKRIVDIFGIKLSPSLLPLQVETSLGEISGFVGKPESSHKKNVQQYFFVNGRYMKHGVFHKAVQSVYERLVPQGEQVMYFIYFTISPEDIDVNIHPTKTEIKFQDEQAVRQILSAAVKDAVGKYSTVTAIDFDTEDRPEIPLLDGTEHIIAPSINFNPQYNPFKETSGHSDMGEDNTFTMVNNADSVSLSSETNRSEYSPSRGSSAMRESSLNFDRKNIPDNWEALYANIEKEGEKTEASLFDYGNMPLEGTDNIDERKDEMPYPTSPAKSIVSSRSNEHYQYKGAYILTSVEGGLMITDQERAHERVLYEKYMKEMESHHNTSQRLLFPETVQFTVAEMMALPAILPEMEKLGFELTNLGGGTYAINAIPAELEGLNYSRMISEMVCEASEHDTEVGKELFSSLAASMAHSAAIPHGQVLTNEEMENIISLLLECENSRYTPYGKLISQIIPHNSMIAGL